MHSTIITIFFCFMVQVTTKPASVNPAINLDRYFPLTDHDAVVGQVAVSEDGNFFVASWWNSVARTFEIEDGDEVAVMRPKNIPEAVNILAKRTPLLLRRDFSRLLTGGYSTHQNDLTHNHAVVQLWNPQNGKLLKEYLGLTDEVVALAIDKKGNLVAGASRDGNVIVWDANTAHILAKRKNDQNYPCKSLVFGQDGKQLYGAVQGEVQIWDANNLGSILTSKLQPHDISQDIIKVAFSSTDDTIFVASYAKIWRLDPTSLKPDWVVDRSPRRITDFVLDQPTGEYIISVEHIKKVEGRFSRLAFLDQNTGNEVAVSREIKGLMRSAAMHDSVVVTGSDDGVRLWTTNLKRP